MMGVMYSVKRSPVPGATMRVSREEAAATRERILEAASRLFRERGYDGIGVADLMKGAGLTHGGFYSHFDSKEHLMAEASARALRASAQRWSRIAESDGTDALARIVRSYLSSRHRDSPGTGCAIATLASEAPRQGGTVRRAINDGLAALVDVLAGLVPGRTAKARRERALVAFSAMLGALVLSRAVDDRQLSDEILDAVARAISPDVQ